MDAKGQGGQADEPLRTGWLVAEFLALFFAVPVFCAYLRLYAASLRLHFVPIIPLLLVFAAGCLVLLMRDPDFSRRCLWNFAGLVNGIRQVLAVFVFAGAGLTAAVLLLQPAAFLSFVKERPDIWALVMVLYPLVSVYPQELVFRAFMFHRYRGVFPTPWVMVLVSAVSFGFVHIVFLNFVAVLLSVVGGFLFAWTYQRTRSLLAACVEHSLYGCLIFTIGLGGYFFHGTMGMARALAR